MDSDPAYNTIKSISEAIVKYCKVELTFAWTSNQIGSRSWFFLAYILSVQICFVFKSFFQDICFIHLFIIFIFSMLGRAGPGSFPRQCRAPMLWRRNLSCRRSCLPFRTQIKSCVDEVSLSVPLHRSYSALCPQHRPSVARCLVLPESVP